MCQEPQRKAKIHIFLLYHHFLFSFNFFLHLFLLLYQASLALRSNFSEESGHMYYLGVVPQFLKLTKTIKRKRIKFNIQSHLRNVLWQRLFWVYQTPFPFSPGLKLNYISQPPVQLCGPAD